MAQANSAQREPSMEEILASIRRIIEDSDTARQQTDQLVGAAPAEETMLAEEKVPARQGSVIEVESFRADLRASAEAYEAGKAEPAAPVSLADIRAEVRSAAAGKPAWPGAAAAVAGDEEMSAVDEALANAVEDGGLDQDEMIAELSEQLNALNDFEPGNEKTSEAKPAILSEQAGRQVAAAFGELSDAFSTNRRRSFEEIAEEMMRPMLQDWLDNNLPVLVERLVREEIERVARG
jgi:cell pole-organizing protein PopZ